LEKSIIPILIIIVLVSVYFFLASRTDTFTGRWVAWKSSGIEDYLLFPAHTINHAPPVYNFEKEDQNYFFERINYQYKGKSLTTNMDSLLESTGTTAFIVIKDDTILYEKYFNGYLRDSIVTSFSIAKSFTSLMIGKAIDEGFIESLEDPVTRYVPELIATDPDYEKITLEHLLSMKSGIAFKDTDIPWHDKSKAYYHPQLRKVVTQLPLQEAPGERFVYNTFNPIILGIVLENATGMSASEYFESRIWKVLGMEFDASWSIDSDEDNMVKMESGLNARAIDYAKMGRLILQNGNWNGNQIISPEWIEQSSILDPTNNVAKFGENFYYQNGWWIIGPTDSDLLTVFAWGHLGQYIFIFPEDDVLILRFGERIGKVDSWRKIAQEIVLQLNKN
jgi:CubicO group peptidase (beta-lactamase class C family)